MVLQAFEEYFTRVTDGRYVSVYGYIGDAIREADVVFSQKNNGAGVLDRPDLYESYSEMVQDSLRNMGAPIDLEREVGKRLKEFFKLGL